MTEKEIEKAAVRHIENMIYDSKCTVFLYEGFISGAIFRQKEIDELVEVLQRVFSTR